FPWARNSITLLRSTQPSTLIGRKMSTSIGWGSKSLSALVGLASNTWGSQWRHKHLVCLFCLQVAYLVKRCRSVCKYRYTCRLSTLNLTNLGPKKKCRDKKYF